MARPPKEAKPTKIIYLPNFMATRELARRLLATGAYPNWKDEDMAEKGVQDWCRRGIIQKVKILPGKEDEAVNDDRLPWFIPRQVALALIRAAQPAEINESALQNLTVEGENLPNE